MIKAITKTLVAISLTPTLVASHARAEANVEPGKYQIDPNHSKVGFEIPHLVISTVEGRFREFNGSVELAGDFLKSKVNANISIGSIDTGVGKRDDHLRSADFFDVTKYPKMSFQSSSIKGSPSSFKMEGDLTIRGIKKRVIFEGKYLGTVTDGYGNRKAAFQAKAKINRKDFGLTWNSVVEAGPVVGDEVAIELKIQAARPLQKAQAKN